LAKEIKAEDWSEQHREGFCDLIREHRWFVGSARRDPGHPDWKKPDPQRELLFEALERDGHVVGLTRDDALGIRTLFESHYPYFDQFYDLLKRSVNMFANEQILIRTVQVIADERIPPDLGRAMEFGAWVALCRRFPHFEEPVRQGAETRLVSFRSATDQEVPNLIAADAIAHWYGMTQIPEQHVPGGHARYQAYLDRMSMFWKPPEDHHKASPTRLNG